MTDPSKAKFYSHSLIMSLATPFAADGSRDLVGHGGAGQGGASFNGGPTSSRPAGAASICSPIFQCSPLYI